MQSLPFNDVSVDYTQIIDRFIDELKRRQGSNIESIFITGSYVRGDATDLSDFDLWCVFKEMDTDVLFAVGETVRQLEFSGVETQINAQCFSLDEFEDELFSSWSEKSVKVLESRLLYGNDVIGSSISKSELEAMYKKYMVDILLSVRHYMVTDKSKEKLIDGRVRNSILKPFMFSLRMERYCTTDYYPISNMDLSVSVAKKHRYAVEWFLEDDLLVKALSKDHKGVLTHLHESLIELIGN